MTRPVEVPLWLLSLIVAFAAVAFFSHFLVPSVRWFFRRRMERIVARLNERLDRRIEPFRLMARNDMIVRLVHDPKVMEAVVAEAQKSGEPESVALERARAYAREIVPAFSASVYFGFATRAARWLTRMIYKVRIGRFDAEALGAIDPKATVVFVMNHRSNMDYVLVTHLAAERSALSYAVGEWARVWPLSALIRATGAYFIRRRHNTPLYRRVLARYVQMAAEEGVTQAIFPEGGLSLDGRVGEAKLGLLSYIVQGFRPEGRDVVFIPVALNYDRVLEDRILIEAAARGERRFRARVPAILAFGARNLWRRLRGRFQRFGHAAVSFGAPLSLAEFLAAHREGEATDALAAALMARIRHAVPVLPAPLVAAALAGRGPMSRAKLSARAAALARRLERGGAHVVLPAAEAAAAGIAALELRGVLREAGGRLEPRPGDGPLLAFYAASVLQLCEAGPA